MQQYSVEVKREQMEEFENYLYERENAEATVKKYLSDIIFDFTLRRYIFPFI